MSIITDKEHEHADLVCMLLSNLAKSPHIEELLGLKVPVIDGLREKDVLGQLMEVFVLGENKKWNQHANFDFLANVWGDLTRVFTSCLCQLMTVVSRRSKILVNTYSRHSGSLPIPIITAIHKFRLSSPSLRNRKWN